MVAQTQKILITMPSCFQLFKKGESEPISLNKIDEEICSVLEVPVHLTKYGGGYVKGALNWFDTIGFAIATDSEKFLGSQELRDYFLISRDGGIWDEEAPLFEKVLNYLEANYSSTSFYQTKH